MIQSMSISPYYKFLRYLKSENLEKAKKYYEIHSNEIDIHKTNDFLFVRCCERGKLESAKWLYSIGADPISNGRHFAFLNACLHGRLNVVEWLLTLNIITEDIIIKAKNKYNFRLELVNRFINSGVNDKLDNYLNNFTN